MTVSTPPAAAPFVPSGERLAPYLDGLRLGQLRITRCACCGLAQFPPRVACPGCHQVGRSEWEPASGAGQVWSFCVFHKAYLPPPAPQPPYNVAVIQLDEGPKLISAVLEVPADQLRIGMPVHAVFPDAEDGAQPLVFFRPIETLGESR